jgi:peptide/nickel transport system substrate-binding protein
MDFDMDDDEVDIWMGGWQSGANPSVRGTWGHADWNASRYNSPQWEAILDRVESQASWDPDYLLDAFSAIQWYKYENVFYIPTTWSVALTAVNNRVSSWDTRVGIPPADYGWHTMRLTAPQPYRG